MNKIWIAVAVIVVLGVGGWALYANSQKDAMMQDSNAMGDSGAMHGASTDSMQGSGDSMHADAMASTSDASMHADAMTQ